MGQVHYLKPKRKFGRCCYCCIEVLSGFLLLVLVAAIFTLLRYLLGFSEIPSTYAGSKVKLLSNVTATPVPSSQPMLVEGFESTKRPSHPLAINVTISQESTEPPKSTSPQSSAWGEMDSSQRPTERSNLWTSSWILISARRITSLRELPLATEPKSQPAPTPLTKWLSLPQQTSTVERASLPQMTTATELVSPRLPASATKPASSQPLTSAMEPSSAQQRTPVSSPRLISATETTFESPMTAAEQSVSPLLTTSPNPASPKQLAAFTKWTSPQWVSSAALRLIRTTHLISSQQLSTAMKGTSARQPTSAIKLKYFPQFPTAISWVSPQPLTTATKQTPQSQPTAPITSLSLPQRTKLTVLSLLFPQPLNPATELTYPQQKATAGNLSSPQHPTVASSSRTTLPLTITQPPQTFSAQEVSGQAAEDETGLQVSFKGSFQLADETSHPNYSDPTSDSIQSEAVS